jgi:hypothetical protein
MEGKEVYAVFKTTTCDPKNGLPLVPGCVGVFTTRTAARKAMLADLKDSLDSWDIEYDENEFKKVSLSENFSNDEQPFWTSAMAAGFNTDEDRWGWNIFKKNVNKLNL